MAVRKYTTVFLTEKQKKRFFDRIVIDPVSKCWIWTGCIKENGYGRMGINYKTWHVHFVSYVLHVGHLPLHLEIDHLCRVRHCCNPAHLEAVTKYENLHRQNPHNSGKTHCPQGHIYDEENTYIDPSSDGRVCRICRKLRSREWARKNKGYDPARFRA